MDGLSLLCLPGGIHGILHIGHIEYHREDQDKDGEQAKDQHRKTVIAWDSQPQILFIGSQRKEANKICKSCCDEIGKDQAEAG